MRKRHAREQVIGKLREAEAEVAASLIIRQVCQNLAISEQAYPPLACRRGRPEVRWCQEAAAARGPERPAEAAGGRARVTATSGFGPRCGRRAGG